MDISSNILTQSVPANTFRRRRGIVCAVVLFLLVLGYITVDGRAFRSIQTTDFSVYLAAGKIAWAGGSDLYSMTDARGLHYIYPPAFAVLISPLSLLPPRIASTIWYFITLAVLLLGLRITLDLVTPKGQRPEPSHLWIPVLICADPLLGTISRGQLSIVMFTCAVIALSFYVRGKPFAAGFLVAFITVLKIYSGLLVLYFLFRKDWRALLGCAAGILVLGLGVPSVAFGFGLTVRYWTQWITAVVLPFSNTDASSTSLFLELHNLTL